jgi:spore germination protein GerM
MKQNALIALVVIAVAAALVFWAGAMHRNNEAPGPTNGTNEPATSTDGSTATGTPASTSRVKIALLDPDHKQGTKERGCDTVVMVDRTIPATSAPLTAALKQLFSEKELWINGLYNFISKTRDTLLFDRATVENGVAKIYLTGDLGGLSGVCDDPRAAAQIEETALQFPTVQKVELYLNGERVSLVPSQKGDTRWVPYPGQE